MLQFRCTLQLQSSHIRARHLLVVRTVSVEKSVVKLFVRVWAASLVAHLRVDQNVLWIAIVVWTKLARIKSVEIHALVLAVLAQIVKSSTIGRFVRVNLDWREIRSRDAMKYVRMLSILYFSRVSVIGRFFSSFLFWYLNFMRNVSLVWLNNL